MTQIAKTEGKSLTAKVAEAVREYALGYERVTTTVTGYAKKKVG